MSSRVASGYSAQRLLALFATSMDRKNKGHAQGWGEKGVARVCLRTYVIILSPSM